AMPQHGVQDENGTLVSIGEWSGEAGLTKLEHFAGLAIPPMEMIIEAMTEHSSPFNLDDYITCAVSYKVKEAKALLAQLDREKAE
ncbi:MAG: hypothetical protein V7765_21820, partial [Oleispira sp.]